MLHINRGDATILNINATGSITEKIMDANVVDVQFTLAAPFTFLVGDFIEVEGKQFFLNSLPEYDYIETRQTNYTLQFQSENYELAKVQYQFLDENNELKEADFSLMANAQIFLALLIQNMNRVQSGWVIGDVIDSDYRNLSFSNENCSQVLSNLADEFETEWWIDGKTIHLAKRTAGTDLILQYGKGNGLCDISRKNVTEKQLVTRLYVLGGTKNIPGDYRNYSTRLKLPESTGGYLEKNVDKYGVIESTLTLEDIYPKREGVVSAVVAGDDNWQYFTDAAIDFDVNAVLMPGISCKVTFNTGQLAGYTFEMSSFNNATKQFVIAKNSDEKAIDVPSNLLRPAAGDVYVLTDIIMPASYITKGENELFTEGADYLDQNCDPRVIYSGQPNRMFFKQTGVPLTLGSTVTIQNGPLGIDDQVRITSLTRDLFDLYNYTAMDLSESVSAAPIVRQYAKQEKIDKAIRINNLLDPNRARNNWRTTQEALAMVFDAQGDYYTDKIKPLSIETTLFAAGAKPQQFELSGVVIDRNYTGNPNKIRISAGTLTHFTIDDATIRIWQLAAYANDTLANQAYFMYARCNKSNSNDGQFLITAAQILVDSDASYYHFLIGTLHTPIDGVRGISFSYGETTIDGKFIKTGDIVSQDGNTYFNLDKGEIGGKITFVAASGLSKPVSEVDTQANYAQMQASAAVGAATSAALAANNAQTAANLANQLLANIASDNVLSASEKPAVLKEVKQIQSEFNLIANQAFNYGLATTDYANRYYELMGYANPLIADLTQDSAINGDVFRAAFNAYYSARLTLLNQISDVTKAIANGASNTAISAQTTAINAQSSANAANAAIANISSDNVLSAGEKSAIKDKSNEIQKNTEAAGFQADTWGINHDDLYGKNGQLQGYLSPLLANMSTDSAIDGPTFRSYFSNWYSAYTNVLNLIAQRAYQYQDNNYYQSLAAQTTATNAANAATSAQSAANVANAALADIASDFVLSAGEKPAVLKEVYQIQGEVNSVSNQAANYGISPTGYQNIYNSLIGYITPLLVDMASNTAINGDQFRTFFNNYYNSKIAILKQVSDAAKLLSDNAQSSANFAQSNAAAAQKNAIDAANAAQVAQAAANVANLAVANIASDNVLSASEKQATQNQFNEIYTEQPTISNQAIFYGINPANYQTIYTQLTNYLTPLLQDRTTDSAINGDAFRTQFGNYYYQKSDLLQRISSTAKGFIDSAQNSANSAAATAINAQSSANAANAAIANISSDNVLSAGEKSAIKDKSNEIQKNTEAAGFQADTWGINHDDLYERNGQLQGYLAPLLANMAEDTPIDGPTFRTYFTNWYNSYNNVLNLISQRAYQYQDSHYYQIVAAAAQATNAQNTASYVSGITSFLHTTVNGNVVATGTMLIGDATDNNGGITGVTDNSDSSVRAFLGATYANKNIAPWRVLQNGKMYATNAEISGKIEANSGKIGNWSITDKGLENVDSSGGPGAYIKQRVDYGSDSYMQTSLGIGIGGTNNLSVLTNRKKGAGSNGGLIIDVANGTTDGVAISPNAALTLANGDFLLNNGKIIVGTNNIGQTVNVNYTGLGGLARYMKFINGILVAEGSGSLQ